MHDKIERKVQRFGFGQTHTGSASVVTGSHRVISRPPNPALQLLAPAVSPSPLRTLISDLATVLPFPERRGVGITPRASPADWLLPAAVCALTFPRGRPGLVGFSAPWSLWASRRDHTSIASRTERPRGPDAVDGASPLSRRA